MRIQNKRSLYESIMRDVARVVKRRLNEGLYDFESTNSFNDVDDMDMNIASKKKLSEYTFRDILNPIFNRVLHNDSPDIFKLDHNGRIGFDVYAYKNIRDANRDYIPNDQKPSFVLYEDNIAFAIAKLSDLIFNHRRTFGKCNPKIERLYYFFMRNIPGFADFIHGYLDRIDEIKQNDPWFINHSRRIYGKEGDEKIYIKIGEDGSLSLNVIEDIFTHLDHVCPLDKFVRKYL